MKIIQGNLLDLFDVGKFNIIAHGCNCFNVMGAGIARQIAKRYPVAYTADIKTKAGDINKLGTFSVACVDWHKGTYIYNLYTQFDYGSGLQLNYDALAFCLYKLNYVEKGNTVGLPLIGGGLAGGDHSIIIATIESCMKDCDTTLVLLENLYESSSSR